MCLLQVHFRPRWAVTRSVTRTRGRRKGQRRARARRRQTGCVRRAARVSSAPSRGVCERWPEEVVWFVIQEGEPGAVWLRHEPSSVPDGSKTLKCKWKLDPGDWCACRLWPAPFLGARTWLGGRSCGVAPQSSPCSHRGVREAHDAIFDDASRTAAVLVVLAPAPAAPWRGRRRRVQMMPLSPPVIHDP